MLALILSGFAENKGIATFIYINVICINYIIFIDSYGMDQTSITVNLLIP